MDDIRSLSGSGWFSWKDAREIAHHYFDFWPDGEDLIWAKQCWAALDKSGLTIYHSEEEELVIRRYVGVLALFYAEACYVFWDEVPTSIVRLMEVYEDSPDQISDDMTTVRSAICDYYSEREFLEFTIESLIAGASDSLPRHLLSKKVSSSVESAFAMNDPTTERLLTHLTDSLLDVESFQVSQAINCMQNHG